MTPPPLGGRRKAPPGWRVVTLDQIKSSDPDACRAGPFGSSISQKYFVEEGIPVIRGNNLSADLAEFVANDFVFVAEARARETYKNYLVRAGDLVVTCWGTIGQVGRIPEDGPFEEYVISNKQLKLRTDPAVADSKFIFYYIASEAGVEYIKSRTIGAAVPGINLGILKSIPVALPSIQVQRSIVSVLSAYDDLIENNRRRMALLEEAARQLYREWFVRLRFPDHEHTRIIDGVPEGWERKTFNDVCQAVGGGTPSTKKPEYWDDGDIIWVTPTDITRNPCLALLDSEKKITETGLKNSSAKMLPPDTVMMTSRASVGFFGLIDKPACTNQGFISVIPNEPLSRLYLLHNLMHRVDEIRSHAGGTTYKEISKSKFKALPVVMPSSSLLRDFEDQTAESLKQVRTLHTMNARLSQARDLLLPRLMNGEIAV
jgi:type I restriction enzyme S subunit